MAFYPNHIIIKSTSSQIQKDKIILAARNLKGEVAFKFYLYLCLNQDNNEFDYSPQEFAAMYGVSMASAYSAADKLIKVGYLVESENRKNDYYFFDIINENLKIF